MKKTKETGNKNVALKRVSWIIWGSLAVLVLLLASAFSRTWGTNRALRQQVDMLAPMLTASSEEQATLQVELTRVQSNAYVEQWSKEHAGMTQPDEVLIILITPTATITPLPSPTPLPTPTPTPKPFWKTWWESLASR